MPRVMLEQAQMVETELSGADLSEAWRVPIFMRLVSIERI